MLTIFRLIMPLLAGLGAGAVLDKVAADKIPNYPAAGTVSPLINDESGNFSPKKIIWFVVVAVAGTLIVKFIGKKLNIKILK